MSKLINPLTGRTIKFAGPTHIKLIETGVLPDLEDPILKTPKKPKAPKVPLAPKKLKALKAPKAPQAPQEDSDPDYEPGDLDLDSDSDFEELDIDEFTLVDAYNAFQEVVKISGNAKLIKEVAKLEALISKVQLEELAEIKEELMDHDVSLKAAEYIDPYYLENFKALNIAHPKPTTKRGNSGSINERHVGKCLHKIFPKNRFANNIRPEFLKNKESKKALELDWYNRKLQLAVEYQGKQHYQMVSKFQDQAKFNKRLQLDQLKRDLCKTLGITLIEVPYTIKQNNIMNFLGAKLQSLGKL